MKIKVFPHISVDSEQGFRTALEQLYSKIQKRAEKKDPLAKDLFVMCSVAQELWNQLHGKDEKDSRKNS